jgi:REP element-mobilizing transposase RayT
MRELRARKAIRLKGYNYSQTGCYFVTVCVKDALYEYGIMAEKEINNISIIRKECKIDTYVIMPNHIHMIVRIVGDDGNRPDYQRIWQYIDTNPQNWEEDCYYK